MCKARFLLIAAFGTVLLTTGYFGAPAQQKPREPRDRPPTRGGAGPAEAIPNRDTSIPTGQGQEIVIGFPTNDVTRTAWKVKWTTANGSGLIIQGAWFKKHPNEPWVQILGDARLSEMLVPYHSGSPRFWDVSYNFSLMHLTRDDAGAYGRLIGNPPVVCQEIRDRGLAWMDGTKGSRRGQTLVLWAALNAANYRYVVEYGFQDDGTIAFRVGSTGRNYSSREFEGHMHNALWRIDINLDGPAHNSAYIMEHIETPEGNGTAKTVHRPFNQGREGFEDWDAYKFTMVNIRHEKRKNIRGMPLSYDVMALRMGNARHYGPQEECTLHDFWVTKNRPGEMYYQKLPKYIERGESVIDTDIVLWLSTPGHHEPRSEDGAMQKNNSFVGATPVMWCGFDLKPRNWWDRSPLYP
ncbi:MAG: hypothetical protein NZO58_10400 [Gemmataceae bacterium]|nr:hypothetical protein [Gemmataceae bacterium]